MMQLRLLASHMVGDYVFQTNEQAIRKTEDVGQLLAHVATYTAAFIPTTLSSSASGRRRLLFLVSTFCVHLAIDHRRWASGAEWGPKPIMVDQSLHAIQLAILGELLK